MTVVIRPAVPADADAIAALNAEGWRETYRGAVPQGWPDPAEVAAMRGRWRDRLDRPEPGALILVARLDGAFAGFMATRPALDEPGTDLFQNLYVVPDLRGHGVGAALLREGAGQLAAIGQRAALVRVVAGNSRARAFYRDLGGAEGAPVRPLTGARSAVELVPYRWERLLDLARAARRRLARRLDSPVAVATLPACAPDTDPPP
jgi:ribosomal protein S18 acetylase RimI-like enzyme